MLYLHIPLCASKCHYCDFYSVAARGVDVESIVGSMINEIEQRHDILTEPLPSIYFGGGTPSLLSIEQIGRLLHTATHTFGTLTTPEITLEANPEQLSEEYLEGLIKVGINRLSIGIQSFSDQRLSSIGRRHNAQRAIEAIMAAQKIGFNNISIDLMFGFSDMETTEWTEQLDQAFSLNIQHLSAYQLSIEPHTLFARRGVTTADEEEAAAQYALLCHKARQAGFEHYEISNFALPNHRSRHNSGYWSGEPYIGVGASAHSFDGKFIRSWNVNSIHDYINNKPPQSEYLTANDLHNEFIMTRLRTSDGFSLSQYRERFNTELIDTRSLQIFDDRVTIIERNWFIADSIICNLFK